MTESFTELLITLFSSAGLAGALFAALILALIPTILLFLIGQKQLLRWKSCAARARRPPASCC